MSYSDYGSGGNSVGKTIPGKMWDRPEYKPPKDNTVLREGSDHSHILSSTAPTKPAATDRLETITVAAEKPKSKRRQPKPHSGYNHYHMRAEQELIYPLLSDKPITPAEVVDRLKNPKITRSRAWKVLTALTNIGAADKPGHGLYIRKGPLPERTGARQGPHNRTLSEVYDLVYAYLSESNGRFARALVIAEAIGEDNQRVSNAIKRLSAHGKIKKRGSMYWEAVQPESKPDQTIDLPEPDPDQSGNDPTKLTPQYITADDGGYPNKPFVTDQPPVPDYLTESADSEPDMADLLRYAVEHPNHYTWHPKAECKDIAQEFSYNLGTAIAYIWRAEHKGSFESDIRKAIQHLQFELQRKGYTL